MAVKYCVWMTTMLASSTALLRSSSCPAMHNPSANIWKGIVASLYEDHDLARKQIEEMNLDPGVSQCLGSVDLNRFDALQMIYDRACTRTLKIVFPKIDKLDFELDEDVANVIGELRLIIDSNQGNIIGVVESFQDFFYNLKPELYSKLTVLFRNGFKDCLKRQIVPKLFNKMIDGKGKCCESVKAAFKSSTNLQLTKNEFQGLVMDIVNFLFTVSPDNHSCLYRFVRTYFEAPLEIDFKNLLAIPSNQGCAAVNGQEFKSMNYRDIGNYSHQFTQSVGCCAIKMDTLVQKISTFPIVHKYLPPEAFDDAEDSCVPAIEVQIIMDSLDLITDPELKARAELFVEGLCLHLPNGFSSTCNYVDPSICTSV